MQCHQFCTELNSHSQLCLAKLMARAKELKRRDKMTGSSCLCLAPFYSSDDSLGKI